MKQHFILQEHKRHLLLFFAGWGMDEHPFRALSTEVCDWMLCYDYRSLDFDRQLINEYESITLMAWSMGVWAASQVMRRYPDLPILQRTAINGTLYPIDDSKGIAPSIFEGTLQGLAAPTLQKFQRRMCGSAANYQNFLSVAPKRPVEELKEELAAIGQQYASLPPSDTIWQKAVIGNNDRIFLPDHQRNGWEGKAVFVEETEAAHYSPELFVQLINEADVEPTFHLS